MKILCSGNPSHTTVASAVQRKFPTADFASRASGFDLRFWDNGSEDFFKNQIVNYNVFINSSFICKWAQLSLLEITVEEWKKCNIDGHIINIGSTAEWLGCDSVYGDYSIQKQALKDRSLQLNGTQGIKVTHLILGGLNDGKPGHEQWLNLDIVADTIHWILHNPAQVPLIALQSTPKKS